MNIVEKLVSEGELEAAIDALEPYIPLNYFVLLKGRFSNFNDSVRKGILNDEKIRIGRSQISDSILQFTTKYGDKIPKATASSSATKKTSQAGAATAGAKIYFSYAWGDPKEEGESREKIVNELYDALLEDGFTVIRDKMNLGYGGLISKFMKEIGKGDLIVVFVSQKYAKSPYCMFELYEIARNNRWEKEAFAKSILPVPVEFIDFGDPDVLDEYFSYWEEQEQKWAKFVTKRIGQISEAQSQKYHNIKEINQNFGNLSDWLIDINASTVQLLKQNNFGQVKDAILQRLGKA